MKVWYSVRGGRKTQQIRFFNWTDYKQISIIVKISKADERRRKKLSFWIISRWQIYFTRSVDKTVRLTPGKFG